MLTQVVINQKANKKVACKFVYGKALNEIWTKHNSWNLTICRINSCSWLSVLRHCEKYNMTFNIKNDTKFSKITC